MEEHFKRCILAPGTSFQLYHIGEGVYAASLTISPEIAALWLPGESDMVWRSRNWDTVALYKHQMEENQWVFDGNTIKFDAKGKLIDGQHRLAAAIASKVSFRTVVVMGAIDQHPMADTGKKRSLIDWLRHKKTSHPSEVAGILRFHARWITASNGPEFQYNALKGGRANCGNERSNEDLLNLLDENPHIVSSAAFARRTASVFTGLFPRIWVGHLHYLFGQKSDDGDADKFFNDLAERTATLDPNNPLFLLRSFLDKRRIAANRSGVTQKDAVAFYAVTIMAWNAYVLDSDLKALRWGPRIKQSFPEILSSE